MAPIATAALRFLKSTAVQHAVAGGDPNRNRNRRRNGLLALGGAIILLPFAALTVIAALLMSLLAPIGATEASASEDCLTLSGEALTASPAALISQFDEEQLGNAQTIIQTGQQLGIPTYGLVIATATAIQESSLVNVGYGDTAGPDSRGLFQQRAPWGPEEKRMDPPQATTYFFSGGEGGQRGLLDVPNWERLPLGTAAQAVQVSADSTGAWYAQHESTARALVSELGDGVVAAPGNCGPDPQMSCPQTPYADVESGLMPDAQLVLRCLHQEFPEIETFHGVGERPAGGDGDHAAGRAVDAMIPDYDSAAGNDFGWQVAEWLREHHRQLGIKYLIFDERIWSVQRADEDWRPYESYLSNCSDDSCRHIDHVHVSVYGAASTSQASGDWVVPLAPGSYNLTARFGQCGGPWSSCHTGLDFAAPSGTNVHAATDGTVVYAGPAGAYGNMIRIDHGNGVVTNYAHLSGFASGVEGAQVRAGTVIGYVGSTGNSSGPHLHFEVRSGKDFQDPEQWLRDHGVDP